MQNDSKEHSSIVHLSKELAKKQGELANLYQKEAVDFSKKSAAIKKRSEEFIQKHIQSENLTALKKLLELSKKTAEELNKLAIDYENQANALLIKTEACRKTEKELNNQANNEEKMVKDLDHHVNCSLEYIKLLAAFLKIIGNENTQNKNNVDKSSNKSSSPLIIQSPPYLPSYTKQLNDLDLEHAKTLSNADRSLAEMEQSAELGDIADAVLATEEGSSASKKNET